ncbi:helix-turn-helix domain-containing protein [Phocicoccus pinnipedialis]|uniref:Helix-turn-helix protein n=1 Tax=Phocicoccus pinnipedialis TaxID=110845 RepID=A0A6V7R611_9BACL|nr:helix-turn-helix transcriptional regulator [Jeotgalicoccus pinnipedialis]MBP1939700.1 transcriptional regulator with XRE-family HTH domain [Jeotgalicoccus pinnipedialis]CAD2072322.1 helix-turn-helix protein [Jeotgalicoccus pinnipedialis]
MVRLIGDKIRQKRISFGYSQKTVAKMCNSDSQSMISRLENNHGAVNYQDLFRVLNVLELSITDVMEEEITEERQLLNNLKELRIRGEFSKMMRLLKSYPLEYYERDIKRSIYYYWYSSIYHASRKEYYKADRLIDAAIKEIEDTNQFRHLFPEILIAKGNITFGKNKNGLNYYIKANKLYHPISSSETYKDIVRINYLFAAAHCRTEKYNLAHSHIDIAIKELNKYESNYLRVKLELSRLILLFRQQSPEFESQKLFFLKFSKALGSSTNMDSLNKIFNFE